MAILQYGVLVFLDADTEVTADSLGELVAPLAGAEVGVGNYFPQRANEVVGTTSLQSRRCIAVRRQAPEQIVGLSATDRPG